MTVSNQPFPGFVKGEVYVRKKLHEDFGGQPQSGIVTPSKYPIILLFSGDTGREHGYGYDGWKSGTVFRYTGEGQKGDQSFVRGNKALRDHESIGERVFLFEQLPKRGDTKGKVRFIDEVRYIGHQIERRDSSGIARNVIVFDLERVT